MNSIRDAATEPATSTGPELVPTWYHKFREMYISSAGICFLLCGDIHGIAARDVSQLLFLQKSLTSKFDIVVYYHRAAGICFPLDEPFEGQEHEMGSGTSMRARAKELLGAGWSVPQEDPYTAALDASGILSSTDVFQSARKPKQALAVLEQLLRARDMNDAAKDAKERVAVIIDCVDYLCPPTGKATMSPDALDVLSTLQYWGSDRTLMSQGNPVFLLTRRISDIHEDLRESDSGYKVIPIDLPDERTRLEYVTWYQQHREQKGLPAIPLVDLSLADVARMTAGIGLHDVEDIFLLGAVEEQEGQGATGITRSLVKAYKDDIITAKYSEIATMLEPLPGGFADLGGMDHLINLTQQNILAPMQEGRKQDVLSRFLLVGPPGTGKTYYAQALAREIGFSALSLNMENILDKWVGSSERNLAEFFQFARALAPVLIFLDEADQTELSRRGGSHSGSGTSVNLFSAMLRFAGDPTLRGRVLLVLASNRPDLFDPALLRRMDAIIPVLLADESGRLRILEKQAQLQGVRIAPEVAEFLARQTDRYSASDLEALVGESRWQAALRGSCCIEQQDAEIACMNLRPVTREMAEWFTLKAVDACNNLRFCPPEYEALWRNRGALHETIKEKEMALPFQAGPRQPRTL